MPYCGCFHDYNLKSRGSNTYQIDMYLEGDADFRHLLVGTGLAVDVDIEHLNTFSLIADTRISLQGVNNFDSLKVF